MTKTAFELQVSQAKVEEADQLSDTIYIMRDGKELAQGTPESLRNYTVCGTILFLQAWMTVKQLLQL